MTLTPAKVPVHLSERNFRRYEHVIQTVVSRFPKKCSFDPAPFSIETYKCRLRDAMKSVLTYSWTTAIDLTILATIRPLLVVNEEDGMVVVVEKNRPDQITLDHEPKDITHQADSIVVVEPTIQDLFALAYLMGRKLIHGPILLKNPNHELMQKTQDAFDIAFREEGENTYML